MADNDTPPHQAIATVASVLILVGLIGLMLLPHLLLVWSACVFFGIAGLARAFIDWRSDRRRH